MVARILSVYNLGRGGEVGGLVYVFCVCVCRFICVFVCTGLCVFVCVFVGLCMCLYLQVCVLCIYVCVN